MKKVITLIAAAAAVMLAISCQKENAEFEKATTGKLTATIVNSDVNGKTRVSYTETEEYELQPAWQEGDAIIGFDDSGNTYTLSVKSVSEDGIATLSGTVPDGNLHLIYKYGAQASDISNKTLTVDYTAQAGDETMPAVMLADGTVTDGVCNFEFHNAGSVIGFPYANGLPSGSKVTKITVRGENLSSATIALNNDGHLMLTATEKENDAISTSTLSGITVTDENGTLSSPIFIAVPAGAVISKVVADNYSYTPESPKNVVAGKYYLHNKDQKFKVIYKYTVRYLLWDDFLKGKETVVADNETRDVTTLPITVTEPAKTGNDLKPKYRKYYQPVPGYESVTVEIIREDQVVYIFYQKKSSSS